MLAAAGVDPKGLQAPAIVAAMLKMGLLGGAPVEVAEEEEE